MWRLESSTLRHSQRTQAINILDLLQSDILAIAELDQVLDPVDYLETALLVNQANVTSVKPAIFRHRLLGLGFIVKVLWNDHATTSHDFTARIGLVGAEIVHLP